MIKKAKLVGTDQVRVTFTVPATTWADRVNLVGEFNDWDIAATPMYQSRTEPDWQITLDLDSGHRYRFRYLLDGSEWLNDWRADGYIYESAPHRVCDSIVDLSEPGPFSQVSPS